MAYLFYLLDYFINKFTGILLKYDTTNKEKKIQVRPRGAQEVPLDSLNSSLPLSGRGQLSFGESSFVLLVCVSLSHYPEIVNINDIDDP